MSGRRFGDWPAAQMAEALARAADEHGVPNTFTPGEIAAHYSRFGPTRFGRSASRIVHVLRGAGYAVRYVGRRFIFEESPTPAAVLARIEAEGFDRAAFVAAVDAYCAEANPGREQEDAIAATHPSRWMTPEEVEGRIQDAVLDLIFGRVAHPST